MDHTSLPPPPNEALCPMRYTPSPQWRYAQRDVAAHSPGDVSVCQKTVLMM